MVNLGTVLGLSALGLIFFFRDDISQSLQGLKGFGSNFGAVNLPDININVPKLPTLEGLPDVGGVIFDAGVGARQTFDQGIKKTQEDFEQFGTDVNTNITNIGLGAGVAGADIQETFTGNRNAIGDFFTNIFGGHAEGKIDPVDGAPVVTPTVTTPATIERQAGRRTFGGQTQPKMTLTKTQASTTEQSNIIISKQPDLSLVSPFLKTSQVIQGEQETTSRFSGTGSRR